MARIRLYEPYGYEENNEYIGKITQLDNELAENRNNDKKEFASVEYSETLQAFVFKNVGGDVVGMAEIKDIVPSELIKDAKYDVDTKSIIITFSNDQTIEIPLDDIIDVAEAGNGLELSDNKFSVKLASDCETFLTVDENGVKLSGVQDAINVERDRAISAETAETNRAVSAEIAETSRATQAEADLSSAINLETTNRISEDNRIMNDILTRIWTKKSQDSGTTGFFKTVTTNGGNSYAQLWNEPSGGGAIYYNGAANIKSFVGVNADNADGICVQIYSKNNASNIGSRLNVNPNGMYYTTQKASGSFSADDELITKKDKQELQSAIDTLAANIEALSSTVTSLSNAITTINNEITTLNGKISSLDIRVTALENNP